MNYFSVFLWEEKDDTSLKVTVCSIVHNHNHSIASQKMIIEMLMKILRPKMKMRRPNFSVTLW